MQQRVESVLMRGAHAASSPNFGAPAAPAAWQALHCAVYTCSPLRSCAAPEASRSDTRPTGCNRAAIASSLIASLPAPSRLAEPTKLTSSTMITTGSTKAAITVQTSCLGVRIRPSCDSYSGWLSLMDSSVAAGAGGAQGSQHALHAHAKPKKL